MENFFIFVGLSNGTFLGLSALKELYLSHNEIERIESGYFFGLNELEILRLDNNRIQWINGDILTVVPKLKVLTLHSNHLVSLQLEISTHSVAMHLVTIHDNRWHCSNKNDCAWITQTVDTLNKSAVKYLNQVNVSSQSILRPFCEITICFRSPASMQMNVI